MENISNEMDSSDLFGISSGDSQENQILQMQPLAATGFSPARFEHQASLESLMNFLDNDGDAQNSEIEPKREFLELTESPNQVECSNVELLSGLSSDTFENEESLESFMGFLDDDDDSKKAEIQTVKEYLEKELELTESPDHVESSNVVILPDTSEFNKDPEIMYSTISFVENNDTSNIAAQDNLDINCNENYNVGGAAEPLVINDINELNQPIVLDEINNKNEFIMANEGQEKESLDEYEIHNYSNQSISYYTDNGKIYLLSNDGSDISGLDITTNILKENGPFIISNCDNENTNKNSNKSCNTDGPIELINAEMDKNNSGNYMSPDVQKEIDKNNLCYISDDKNVFFFSDDGSDIRGLDMSNIILNENGNYTALICNKENTKKNSNEPSNINESTEATSLDVQNEIKTQCIVPILDQKELSLNNLQDTESQLLYHAPSERLVINDINALNQSIMFDQIDNNNGYIMANVGQENNIDESHKHNNSNQSITYYTDDGKMNFLSNDGSDISGLDISTNILNENDCYNLLNSEKSNMILNESEVIEESTKPINAKMNKIISGNNISSDLQKEIDKNNLRYIRDDKYVYFFSDDGSDISGLDMSNINLNEEGNYTALICNKENTKKNSNEPSNINGSTEATSLDVQNEIDINNLNHSSLLDQIKNKNKYIMVNVGQENGSLDNFYVNNQSNQSIAYYIDDGKIYFFCNDGSDISGMDISTNNLNENVILNREKTKTILNEFESEMDKNNSGNNKLSDRLNELNKLKLCYVRVGRVDYIFSENGSDISGVEFSNMILDENGSYNTLICNNKNTNKNSNESCNINESTKVISLARYIYNFERQFPEDQFDNPPNLIIKIVTPNPNPDLMKVHSPISNKIEFEPLRKTQKSPPRLNKRKQVFVPRKGSPEFLVYEPEEDIEPKVRKLNETDDTDELDNCYF